MGKIMRSLYMRSIFLLAWLALIGVAAAQQTHAAAVTYPVTAAAGY